MEYIIISSISLTFCFLAYKAIYKLEKNFGQLRLFLLASIALSLLLPLVDAKISLPDSSQEKTTAYAKPVQKMLTAGEPTNNLNQTYKIKQRGLPFISKFNSRKIILSIYFLGFFMILVRILFQLTRIFQEYISSERHQSGKIVIIYNSRFAGTFSFFHLIFVNHSIKDSPDLQKIVVHEKIHASQMHSIDLLLVELLSAVMWFNPIVWMFKKELNLVHEYLADEGALSTGIDKLQYQALLLNQITEERLICLSSSFNHSLIKKRMIMMTISKFNQRTKLKILALVPLAAVLFLGVACVNGQKKANAVIAVEPVKMNVLYLGVDNPLKIAASGYNAKDLEVSIDNGTIKGKNGQYLVWPRNEGSAIVSVKNNGNVIQETTFRIKTVPDPTTMVGSRSGGTVKKEWLLNQNTVDANMKNFDFDLSFEVDGFMMSTNIDGFTKEFRSTSGSITPEQKELIQKVKEGGRVYFEDVKAKGPDGSVRKLNTIVFKIQ